MADASSELDTRVRQAVYDGVVARTVPPSSGELAAGLGVARSAVRQALERLADGRVLVLQPESREILMAMPFSAVPTPFAVHADGRRYFANCIWDALGIPAMLQRDARIATACGCCGEAMAIEVAGGELSSAAGDVHFSVPARQWWENVAFT